MLFKPVDLFLFLQSIEKAFPVMPREYTGIY
jgi:hypothetical protein